MPATGSPRSAAIKAAPGAIVGEATLAEDSTAEDSAAEPQPDGQRGNPDSEPRKTRNTRKGRRHQEAPIQVTAYSGALSGLDKGVAQPGEDSIAGTLAGESG